MKNINKLIFLLPLAFAVSCAPEFDEDVKFNAGSADFSTYVSVGNSLTAGFQSSALRRVRQENSFPAILAQQFKEIGGGTFTQPLMAAGNGVGSSGNPELQLGYATDCKGVSSLAPVPLSGGAQLAELAPGAAGAGPFNNVAVPGAKSFHLSTPGYDALNPFYGRFATAGVPVINAAVGMNPTFFTYWVGANDVLAYALSGGSGVYQKGNPNAAAYGLNDITDPGLFAQVVNGQIAALSSNGSVKGVVANIPYVTSLPYFSVIKPNDLTLDATQAAQLNAAYAAYNGGIDQALAGNVITADEASKRKISFAAGDNFFVTTDASLTDLTGLNPALINLRQLKSDEYLTLTTPGDSLKCAGWGTAKPIPASNALLSHEIANIKEATDAFNATLKAAADANGLAFLDANKLLSEMESGLTYNGVTYSTEFATGGVFSLDGFHPNTRGYAIIANEFIDVINAKYNAKVRKINPEDYEGIIFP